MYKAMYSLLFNRITDALEQLEQLNIGEARRILMQAQCDSESLFVETEDKKEFKPVFAPVGNGNIDFAPVVKKMLENGAKYIFVEQDNAAQKPDPLFEVEQSITYIKNNL